MDNVQNCDIVILVNKRHKPIQLSIHQNYIVNEIDEVD
jgi:hypothetical protein